MVVTILQIVVPSVTSIILFILAFYKDCFISKKEVLKERMNKLYVPFYQKYIVLRLKIPISKFDIETILDVSDFLAHNIQYMNSNTQKLYFDFFKLQLDYIDNKSNKVDTSQLELKLNRVFNKISKNLIQEYIDICNKLRYPKPVR